MEAQGNVGNREREARPESNGELLSTALSTAQVDGAGAHAPALAKLTRPSLAAVSARPRLFEHIDRARGTPLLWICGAAGFGKTTLMSSYLAHRDTESRWYQLDGSDSDVATFFYYMGVNERGIRGRDGSGKAHGESDTYSSQIECAAVHRHDGSSARASDAAVPGAISALPLFTSEYHGDLRAFSRRFFRQLYVALSSPFDIVLDNYHELSLSSPFHDVLASAVTEMPADGRIVVLSREAPPSSMARLRANRQLAVLDAEHLRLTADEANAIVDLWDGAALWDEGALHNGSISPFVRERIYERTKGWAAGFTLMLEQVGRLGLEAEVASPAVGETAQVADTGAQGTYDDAALLCTSANATIFDYLAGEVFQEFDGPTRTLLLECAYLPRLTPSMATALTGDPRASRILDNLHRTLGLVSVHAGDGEPVYQHHPLLRDFLKARAGDLLGAEERRRLRRSSAALLEAAGYIDEAFVLLNDEHDWDELQRLTLDNAERMLRQGRAETLEQMLEALPEKSAARNPWFYYWRAACRFDFAPRESRLFYEKAFAGFIAEAQPDDRALLLSCSGAMDAILYELDDLSLIDQWVEVVERLVPKNRELPWPSAQARVAVSMYIALAFRQPSHPDMRYWGEQAYGRLQDIEETNVRLTSQLLVAITFNYVGLFSRSREVMSTIRETCRLPQVSALAHKVLKDVEAMYYLFTADYERCTVAMQEGLDVGRSSGVKLWTYHLLSSGAAGALGAGDVEAAERLLEKMREYQDGARRLDLVTYHHYVGWMHMLRDDPLAARQSVKTALHLAIECGCPCYEVYCRLALAQIECTLGEAARAKAQLRAAHDIGADIDNRLLHFQWRLVEAEVEFETGDESGDEAAGLASLRAGLEIGREHNFMHTVWWRPQAMAKLCVRALAGDVETAYVQRLVRERALVPDEPPVHVAQWPWPLRVRAFGKFCVERDAEELMESDRAQRKPIEVLKALVGFGVVDVSESEVTGTLWPRYDDEFARKSLSSALHRLRRIINVDNAIVLRHGRLTLNRQCCWVDVSAFERLSEDIERSCVRSECEDSVISSLASRLFSIYRGPFMQGEDTDDRYVAVRERMRSRFVRCVGSIARFWEARGAGDLALESYRRGLDADALAEGNYRQLMLCLRKLGRQAEAVEVYERCRKTMQAELGVEPSPETRAVFEKVVAEL